MDTKLFYGTKEYSRLEDALEDIASHELGDHENLEICIIPPNLDELTDIEDFDEDITEDPNAFPTEIPGTVEISVTERDTTEEDVLFSKNDGLDGEGQTSGAAEYFDFKKPTWMKKHPTYVPFGTNDLCYTSEFDIMKNKIKDLSPRKLFEMLFTDEIVSYIIDQTITYARQKNNHDFTVTSNDIQSFIGILLMTGYHKIPQERMYWSLDDDLGVPCIYKAMSRDRYLEIKKYLHLANNAEIGTSKDRMFKVRPLINMLTKQFCQWGFFHKDLSIDESMVKYFGHNPCKQFIRGKPVRFGYKNWVISSSSGYCYAFDVYCGKPTDESRTLKGIPVGARVVIDLLAHVPNPPNHIVFFDNYFTTYSLMIYLKKQKIRATGTVRENRVKQCPLMPTKEMKKKERGTYDYRFDLNNEILCIKWKDNNICSVLTNYDFVEPLRYVKRWSKAEKAKVNVTQPLAFSSYNIGMGGVDTLDQCISLYRIAVKGKKWWWVLFTYMIDMTITNAWKLHQMTAEVKMDQLEFRRYIARSYLKDAASSRSFKKRKSGSSVEVSEGFHFPEKLDRQLKCCVCHVKARWSCKKCKKTMCIEKGCFEKYHVSA